MKKEKPPKIETESTEKSRYEIKTMEKDIGELKKKLGITEAPVLPPVKRSEPPKELPKVHTPLKPSRKDSPYSTLRKLSFRKVIISTILVIIILLVVGGVYYWWNYLRVPEEESKLPIEKPESEIPAFLVGADEIEVIELLEINIPADVSDVLGEKYTFFLYVKENENRAGFVNKITDHEALETHLRDWENTMKEDLTPIFLGQELGESVIEGFQDNIYRDIDIRYLNFPDPFLTIDYAVIENYLIITTFLGKYVWRN